ncbi:hypothetical protein EEJ42_07150 [Streptomyces botrytidirepellens]|uniref:Uncharacterized protein n=1 Tax=Streptomyces botrytidirepellens TaxID=2486417 RepID=A0A3M8WTT4_9ACTN|nr:hypothetical protein EEJ42_07150 [Streptomyces botrytidirepellens]
MSVQVCARCQTTTRQPVVVALAYGASAGGGTVYACPDCAPTFPKQRDPFAGSLHACHGRVERVADRPDT